MESKKVHKVTGYEIQIEYLETLYVSEFGGEISQLKPELHYVSLHLYIKLSRLSI